MSRYVSKVCCIVPWCSCCEQYSHSKCPGGTISSCFSHTSIVVCEGLIAWSQSGAIKTPHNIRTGISHHIHGEAHSTAVVPHNESTNISIIKCIKCSEVVGLNLRRNCMYNREVLDLIVQCNSYIVRMEPIYISMHVRIQIFPNKKPAACS